MLESFRDVQTVLYSWQRAVMPPEALCHTQRFDRMLEEVEEAKLEIQDFDSDPSKFIGEIIDIIISAIGVLNCLSVSGIDWIEKKVTLMYHKYNPAENKALREGGMGWDQAMQTQKERWARRAVV